MKSQLLRLVTLVSLVTACGGPLKYSVPSTAAAPGADAKIVADVLRDQNQTHLEVEIENLAPPGRVEPSSKRFVCWYRKDSDSTWSRIAALDYDSESREGKLIGSVPLIRFDVEITAEPDNDPASPSRNVVFAQQVGE